MTVVREHNGTAKASQWLGNNIADLFQVMRSSYPVIWVDVAPEQGTVRLETSTATFVLEHGQWLVNDGTTVYISENKGAQ